MGLFDFLKLKLLKNPVVFDLRFFDSQSLPSKTGLKLSGNIVLKGFSKKDFSRTQKEEFYLNTLREILKKENHEWIFIEIETFKKKNQRENIF